MGIQSVGAEHGLGAVAGDRSLAGQRAWTIGIPALVALACFTLTQLLYLFGYVDEDAYILYIYSRHLQDIGQIAFDAVHGPAEGATDFLWMLLISVQYRLGIDPATGGAVLNAIGAMWLTQSALRIRRTGWQGQHLGWVVAMVLVLPYMTAALRGFSALFYVGLYANAVSQLVRRRHVSSLWWTLVLALTRPDGVLLGIGIVAQVLLEAGRQRRIWAHLTLVSLVGLAYFAWRVQYFGAWLPLPLMIKSQREALFEGLVDNVMALWPALPMLAITWLTAPEAEARRTLRCLAIPATLLFVALSLAHQSQNAGFRFQGPIFVSIWLAWLVARRPARQWVLAAALPLLALGVWQLALSVRFQTKPSYINEFPAQLAHELGHDGHWKVALTEAGRMPYFFPAQYVDLVGLNSLDVASGGLTVDKIERFNPDLLFFHHADQYDVSSLPDQPFVRLTREEFFGRVYQRHEVRNPVLVAPIVIGQYVRRHPEITAIYFVRYGKGPFHAYMFDPSRVPQARFEAALTRSFDVRGGAHCKHSDLVPCRWLTSSAP